MVNPNEGGHKQQRLERDSCDDPSGARVGANGMARQRLNITQDRGTGRPASSSSPVHGPNPLATFAPKDAKGASTPTMSDYVFGGPARFPSARSGPSRGQPDCSPADSIVSRPPDQIIRNSIPELVGYKFGQC